MNGLKNKSNLWKEVKALYIELNINKDKQQVSWTTSTINKLKNEITRLNKIKADINDSKLERKEGREEKKKEDIKPAKPVKLTKKLLTIISNMSRQTLWKNIKLLYTELNITKRRQQVAWPKGSIQSYKDELKKLLLLKKSNTAALKAKRSKKASKPAIKKRKKNNRLKLYKKLLALSKASGIAIKKSTDKGVTIKYIKNKIAFIEANKWKMKEIKIKKKGKKAKVMVTNDFTRSYTPPINTAEIKVILKEVDEILKNANPNDFFVIKLKAESKDETTGRIFTKNKNSSSELGLVKDRISQYNNLINWAATFSSVESGYSIFIDKVIVRIIPENSGGCVERTKVLKMNGMKLEARKTVNNNCYFKSVEKFISKKLLYKNGINEMRFEFDLQPAEMITTSMAIKIFNKYKVKNSYALQVIESSTMKVYETENFEKAAIKDQVAIMLIDHHYSLVTMKDYKWVTCDKCYKKFRSSNKHKCVSHKNPQCFNCGKYHIPGNDCNPNTVIYYQSKIKGNRVKYQTDRYTEEDLELMNIIHYDMETHTRNLNSEHMCTIIGFTNIDKNYDEDQKYIEQYNYWSKVTDRKLYEDNKTRISNDELEELKRKVIKGSNNVEFIADDDATVCIEKFLKVVNKIANAKLMKYVDRMTSRIHKDPLKRDAKYYLDDENTYKRKDVQIYLNAFNGAGFDHFHLIAPMLKNGIVFDDFCMANGNLIRARWRNVTLIDSYKYTVCSLRKNLEELEGCEVLKGEFDYSKLDRWSKMSKKDQVDCIKYLESDVLGMRFLYNTLNVQMQDSFRNNLSSFFSTSHATYVQWVHYVMKKYRKSKYNSKAENIRQEKLNEESGVIIIPSHKQDSKVFRPSICGGRCYKSKNNFNSIQKDGYLNGSIKFDDVDDYCIDLDVVSLYPHCCREFEYPIDQPIEMSKDDIKNANEYIISNGCCEYPGIYNISYITNKHLAHAIIPYRNKEGALKWDLKDRKNVKINSVDIDNALKRGYKVEICEDDENIIGYYWKKQRPIFQTYIDDLFKIKKAAKKGSAAYLVAKNMMVSVYGKTGQKPHYTQSAWCGSVDDFWKFYEFNIVDNVELINDKFYVTGTPRSEDGKEKAITKPSYLASFILGYSRRVMLEYIEQSNPYFDISHDPSEENKAKQLDNDIYYTDTDSIQVHVKNTMKQSKKLGKITNDIDGSKIISGYWIAPKLYILMYILPPVIGCLNEKDMKNEIKNLREGTKEYINGNAVYYHIRGKGIQQGYYDDEDDNKYVSQLNYKAYVDMSEGKELKTYRGFQMLKIGAKKNSRQENLNYFSLYTKDRDDTMRELNKHLWNGRRFIGNSSTPYK